LNGERKITAVVKQLCTKIEALWIKIEYFVFRILRINEWWPKFDEQGYKKLYPEKRQVEMGSRFMQL